jgi:hypothetical protein
MKSKTSDCGYGYYSRSDDSGNGCGDGLDGFGGSGDGNSFGFSYGFGAGFGAGFGNGAGDGNGHGKDRGNFIDNT